MATPKPREAFDNDQEYLKDFWITTEFGVDDVDSYDYFLSFFGDGFCPQNEKEKEHYQSLPDIGIKVYRGYEFTSGSPYRMSWTPDKKEAEGFAFRSAMYEKCSRLHGGNKSTKKIMPMLASMTVGKGNIDSVLLERELEYIICVADYSIYDESELEMKIEERPDLLLK